MLKEGKVKALVHDGPRLSYIANRVNKREKRRVLALLPFRFYPQSYAIVLPTDSPLRESINRALLSTFTRGCMGWIVASIRS